MKNNPIKTLIKIASDSFLQATAWMFLGTGILSFGNYLFHLLMGRMLGPSEYGVLESIISFSYILSVPLNTLILTIVKYVSSYKGREDYQSISSLYSFFIKRFLREGLILSGLLVLLSPLISSFLHLKSIELSILLVIFVFAGLFSGLGKGTLQGLSNFFGLAVVNTTESVVKIVLAVTLVIFGLKSAGGLTGIVVAAIATFFVARLFLKSIAKYKPLEFHEKHLIGKFTVPAFFSMLAITSLFTTDVLLARHFLSAEEAGYYAALSILGKVVYFAVSPITLVMFPFVSEKHAKGESYTRIILASIGLTFLGALVVVIIYYLIPDIVVLSLFGKHYLAVTPFVALFGIFIGIYSICYLMTSFFLSIHKTFPSYVVSAAALGQIIGIYFFHSHIQDIITVSIVTTFLLLIILLLYYSHENARKVGNR